jgi:cell division protein FtsL
MNKKNQLPVILIAIATLVFAILVLVYAAYHQKKLAHRRSAALEAKKWLSRELEKTAKNGEASRISDYRRERLKAATLLLEHYDPSVGDFRSPVEVVVVKHEKDDWGSRIIWLDTAGGDMVLQLANDDGAIGSIPLHAANSRDQQSYARLPIHFAEYKIEDRPGALAIIQKSEDGRYGTLAAPVGAFARHPNAKLVSDNGVETGAIPVLYLTP